jgi:hypothetical protein
MSKLTVRAADGSTSYEMASHERKFLTADFDAEMGEGVTIDDVTVTMVDRRTGAAVETGVLDGDPVVNGSVVGQWVDHPPVGNFRLLMHAILSDLSESEPDLTILVPR